MIWVIDAWAATLTGRVSGPDGPVPEATVIAYDRDFDYHYDTTDSRGEFAIADVERRKWRIRVIPPEGSTAAEAWLGAALGPCGARRLPVDEDLDVGDIVLTAGVSVTGRVLDEVGEAIPGAEVVVVHAEADGSFVNRRALTRLDGSYTVFGVPPGEVAVYVAAASKPAQWLPGVYDSDDAERLTLATDEDLGDVSLLPGIAVAGSVTGPDGPVGDGSVTVYVPSVVRTVPIVGGRFEADGLPPGTVTGWARVDGLAYTYWPDRDRAGAWLDVPGEGDRTDVLDFQLPYESLVRGSVAGDGDLSDGAVLIWNDDYTVGFGSPLTADGAFELAQLHPGSYQLVLFGGDIGYVDDVARNSAGTPLEIDVGPGETVSLPPLSLPPEAVVEGRIIEDPTGLPVKGAVVRVSSDEDSFGAYTDADGRYRVGGIVAGTYKITVETFASCPDDEDWVDEGWDDDRSGEGRDVVIATGQRLDVDAGLACDYDHDGMDDGWELANGLDPHGDDSAIDADGDGFDNREEYIAGTDPRDTTTADRGCQTAPGAGAWTALLVLAAAARRRGRGSLVVSA